MTARRKAALRKAQIASAKKRKRNKRIKIASVGVLGVSAVAGGAWAGQKLSSASNIRKLKTAHSVAHAEFIKKAMNPQKALRVPGPYIDRTNSINAKIAGSAVESAALKGKTPPGGSATSRAVTKKWVAQWMEANGTTVGGRRIVRTKLKRNSVGGRIMAELDSNKYEVIFENG